MKKRISWYEMPREGGARRGKGKGKGKRVAAARMDVMAIAMECMADNDRLAKTLNDYNLVVERVRAVLTQEQLQLLNQDAELVRTMLSIMARAPTE